MDGLFGHGMTFTIGRGNELCVAAINALAPLVSMVIGAGILARFGLDAAKHAEIRRALDARRAGQIEAAARRDDDQACRDGHEDDKGRGTAAAEGARREAVRHHGA